MKKTLIALATLAATASFAQSSVTIWGVADAGLQSVKQGGVTKNQLSSSGLSSSQLGFRGTEDLGGGMSASFWVESGMTIDNGTPGGVAFQRRSTIDLAGGFGAIRLGRDYTPTFWNHTVFDSFGTLGSGAGSNITGRGQNATTGARTNNGISYLYGFAANGASNVGKGVYAQATYAPSEQLSTAAKTGEYSGVRLGYADGPLNVALATGEVINGLLKDKEVNIGGSYDLGVANVNAKFGKNTLRTAVAGAGLVPGVAAAEYTYYSIGAKIPMGNGYIPVSYNNSKNNVDSKSANQFAVGYVYNLSKRTMAYTTYSKITNKNGATYGFNGGNGGFGSGLAPTGNGTGFDLGLRHSF
jgi:predicted porin